MNGRTRDLGDTAASHAYAIRSRAADAPDAWSRVGRTFALSFVTVALAACGNSAPPPPTSAPPPVPPAPSTEAPPAPTPPELAVESCEALLNPCCPLWTGCVHVHAAGTTSDGSPRFTGDDGAMYQARHECRDGGCSDYCPDGVCRPGVVAEAERGRPCGCVSGPPEPAPYECVLESGQCVQRALDATLPPPHS